ncbi:MAG: DUF4004 family protein [Deltaproteobacteria bacterium]|nr:DUF4004 family protein [Deltaproteobacteria bacterium]
MLSQEVEHFVSSKEVLEKTGISRATLNNYIRMGILPRPIVRKPVNSGTKIKNLGYFPQSVMERIEHVKTMKKQGNSMNEIIHILANPPAERTMDVITPSHEGEKGDKVKYRKEDECKFKEELKLTLDDISYPAYLVNFDFELEWINSRAENRILNQIVWRSGSDENRNIFSFFFNWKFHSNVKNWRDLVSFHMAFAKMKYSKTWLAKLYKGITRNEAMVLENIYDEVLTSHGRTISDTQINILKEDGSTERYRVYTIFFKEGMLFVYAPSNRLI